MDESTYIQEILNGLGLAINEKNYSEIIINYPINLDKKSMKFKINFEYKITMQMLGEFLKDFLNCDFDNYEHFFYFFSKYSLSLLSFDKLKKAFKNGSCNQTDFKSFVLNLLNNNQKELLRLQQQLDMILDYCLLNPNKNSLAFSPIERLYVLRRISPNLTLLTDNKANYYSVHLFSSYPGNSESQIYDFLAKKKNRITEFDLILPTNLSSILFKSLCDVLKGNVYLKTCKNCNRYFITRSKLIEYCQDIAPGEKKKTCKEIGRRNVFENNKNNDSVLSLYYQVYSRKAMMKSRNPDLPNYTEEFNKFKEIGKKKIANYKMGILTSDDLLKWIEKNS